MWDKIYYFTMVPMVYAAVAVFTCGIIYKLVSVLISSGFRGSLATYPAVLPRPAGVVVEALGVPAAFRKATVFWLFIISFHIAFILLVIGHFELIREFRMLQAVPHKVFLGAGWTGGILMVSVLFFLFRRFGSPWREISVPEDYLVLILLFLTMVIGSHLHLASRYGVAGFDIQLEEYRKYLSSLVALAPVIPDGIKGSPHYVLVSLHIFLANLVIMILPFTKGIHMLFTFFSLNLKRK